MTVPAIFEWTADGIMRPLPRFNRLCDKQYVVGETYRLEVVQERSAESHRHYFAAINEAWNNIPEAHAGRWLTPDKLRRWALIQAGFYNAATYIARSKAEALRVATLLHQLDDEVEIEFQGNVVVRKTAKSQSYKEMSRKEFQASKDGVFAVLDALLGLEPGALARQASPSIAPAEDHRKESERVA